MPDEWASATFPGPGYIPNPGFVPAPPYPTITAPNTTPWSTPPSGPTLIDQVKILERKMADMETRMLTNEGLRIVAQSQADKLESRVTELSEKVDGLQRELNEIHDTNSAMEDARDAANEELDDTREELAEAYKKIKKLEAKKSFAAGGVVTPAAGPPTILINHSLSPDAAVENAIQKIARGRMLS